MRKAKWLLLVLALALILAGCGGQAATPTPTQEAKATPTKAAAPTPTPAPKKELPKKITIGSDTTYPPFEFVDDQGNIVGFDPDLMDYLAKEIGIEYEFVSTAWDGIFAALAAGEFDAVMSAVTITPERAKIVDFTIPYYQVGQVVTVRADETRIQSYKDLASGDFVVGVQTGTTGEFAALEKAQVPEEKIRRFETIDVAFLALVNGDVDAVVADSPTSENYVRQFAGKIKIVGGEGKDAWFTTEDYGIAVQKGNDVLLEALNKAIEKARAEGIIDELVCKWEVEPCEEAAAPAEGMADTIIIGTTDKVTVLDPADSYDFHTWEIHHNTMDTLLHYVPGTTNLEPGLAESYDVSEDGLEYTFYLRKGLKFPDGTPFNAEAVKWSIDRVFRLEGDPSWLVTAFVDRVEVVDEYTVKFVLKNPVNYFPLLVATMPYAPVSPNCYPADEIAADSTCGGMGPYVITKWERDVELHLEANPNWYGEPPKTKKIIVKYFSDATTMRLALENGEIDIATKTLNPTDYEDLAKNPNFQVLEGPGAQIRYLVFNTKSAPFDNPKVRQAFAYAVDRKAIAEKAFLGTHEPLYSMVPKGMWSHIDAFPERDLEMARKLLQEAGFSEDNPLVTDLWWTPTHYGDTEADVAQVLKQSLEETGMIQVNLQSAEWATYKEYIKAGSMPVFLLGWYPDYLDPDNYTWPFAHSGDSDYLSVFLADPKMDELLEAGQQATDLRGEERKKTYEEIQRYWTEVVPTLPLTQGKLLVAAKKDVKGITLDPNMLFHYFLVYR